MEAVFDQNGNLVTDPVNEGSYNMSDPVSDPFGHFIDDVIPYYIHGNSEDDSSSIWDRLTASYDGVICGD